MQRLLETFLSDRAAWGISEAAYMGMYSAADDVLELLDNAIVCPTPHFTENGLDEITFDFGYNEDWDNTYSLFNVIYDHYECEGFKLSKFEVEGYSEDVDFSELEYEEFANHDLTATLKANTAAIIRIKRMDNDTWHLTLTRSCADNPPWVYDFENIEDEDYDYECECDFDLDDDDFADEDDSDFDDSWN